MSVISPEILQQVLERRGTQACSLCSCQSPAHSEVKTAFLESEIKFFMGLHINWETGAKSLSNINMKLDSAKFPFTRRMLAHPSVFPKAAAAGTNSHSDFVPWPLLNSCSCMETLDWEGQGLG